MTRYAIHICGPEAEGSAVVNGRTYRWEYHSYTGPMFLDRRGEPWKRLVGEKHPVWDAFAAWLREYEAAKAARRTERCAHTTFAQDTKEDADGTRR